MWRSTLGYLKNKAFTLIELLAIIVILAIIAVITVPVILGVIDNAKRGAAIDSAYGYRDAIQKFYLSKLYDESYFELEDRIYMVSELKGMGLTVSGKEPTDNSWVDLKYGEVVAFSLKIGDYIVTQYENEEISAVKGTVVADSSVLRDKNNAIIKAQEIINNIDITGKNNQLFDIENGWVAVVNNEVIGYSVKVTENGKNYVVTLNNGTTTCVIKEELDSSEDAMVSIIKAQVATYITSLSNDDTIKSITEDKVLKVSEITTVTKPSGMDDNSWIYIKNNEGIIDYSLKIGNYVVNYSSTETDNMTVEKNGTIRNMPITEIVIPVARTIDGVDYYDTLWIGANPVYYNPTTGASCTDYSESNSNLGNTEGCLKWYAYSEQNSNVNLLLDHNTTGYIVWNSSGFNSSGPYTGSGTSRSGTSRIGLMLADPEDPSPVTPPIIDNSLLGNLQSDTSGWTGIPNRTDSYSMKVEKTEDSIDYTIDYSNYKARIITAQEVANIVGNTTWDETSTESEGFYFDSLGDYGWLYAGDYYWTVSSNASSSNCAWSVSYYGRLYDGHVHYELTTGLRPVITVSKPSIFGS